jgi:hypothetical protein
MPALRAIVLLSTFAYSVGFAQSQSPGADAVRVSIVLNADGSRTVYQFDADKHEATATTTDAEGKAHGKIQYQVDEAGRFASAVVFGSDNKFLFKSRYKYDSNGRLEQETHLGKDDAVINTIIYKYNSAGNQVGYSVFDPKGRLISGTPARPSPTPSRSRNALGR